MPYLIGVTILWAFSYSLIGVYLSGQVDSYFAIFTRIGLALLLFLPSLRIRGLTPRLLFGLMAVGAVEIGLMYAFFYQSFLWLTVPEVLLFTIMTPVYIALIEDLVVGRFHLLYLVTALLAVAGAAVIRYHHVTPGYWVGFLLVQGANLCFAAGQVGYRRLATRLPANLPIYTRFGWFFAGGLPIAGIFWLLFGDFSAMPTTATQWGVLLWLGLGASGLGYCAWNMGASRVDAGTLASMNNVLIPAGLAVNLLFWNAETNNLRLVVGAAIIVGAVVLNRLWLRHKQQHQPPAVEQEVR